MSVLWIAIKNVYELFVEDGSLVLIVLGWLALIYVAGHLLMVPLAWRAPLLAAGCIVALVESILRAAGRARRR